METPHSTVWERFRQLGIAWFVRVPNSAHSSTVSAVVAVAREDLFQDDYIEKNKVTTGPTKSHDTDIMTNSSLVLTVGKRKSLSHMRSCRCPPNLHLSSSR
ncbi:hypothetical protein TNCV_921461 [Trichonephila clavipes]|nr:hypothetical protein TNCV_921461 [Trichonephila clavipes]